MTLLAMYIPKVAESTLLLRLFLFVILVCALIAYSRERWGLFPAAGCICGGLLLAVLPKVTRAIGEDLGRYGNLCREVNQSTLPDWFFVVFAFFDVGWGTAAALLGVLGGWLGLEIVGSFCRYFKFDRRAMK